MLDNTLCIHGHFYQPPREDPWMEFIFPEGSAAPFRHWNERICRESYAPLAWARRVDGQGRIIEIVNCYEHISFNFGPTLFRWLQRADPATYGRILAGDAASVRRLGHGNAMAQVCHHAIMPLASERDKRLEVAWGLADFEARFGRRAAGMWLAEAAVDTPTLEALAAAGVQFTLLAPRQAKAVASLSGGSWTRVNEGSLDVSQPYLIRLPSGREMAIFFYHGGISQAVAFERLLASGEGFWRRLTRDARGGLRPIATDGETYGHHFTFGEMALAYVLDQARRGTDGWRLTNFSAYLAAYPPTMAVELHEPSSWSCVHGVERWRADCGCASEYHPGWNQRWRGPLRQALELVRDRVQAHFDQAGGRVFHHPQEALETYGRVQAGSMTTAAFESSLCLTGTDPLTRNQAWKLLDMIRWSLASFASCAWFFEDLGRIEPLNALTFALRALQLCRQTGGPEVEAELLLLLAQAQANEPGRGSGADIWHQTILQRQETPERLAAQGWLHLWARQKLPAPGGAASATWPGVRLEFHRAADSQEPRLHGRMDIHWPLHAAPESHGWSVDLSVSPNPFALPFCIHPMGSSEISGACLALRDLPWKKRQHLAVTWVEHSEASLFADLLARTSAGAFLYQPFQTSQTSQTLAPQWQALLPGLAWQLLHHRLDRTAGEEELATWLRHELPDHPGLPLLLGRLQAELVERIQAGDKPAVLGLLAQARRMDLTLELWAAQNQLWSQREQPELWHGLAQPLGFVEEEAAVGE